MDNTKDNSLQDITANELEKNMADILQDDFIQKESINTQNSESAKKEAQSYFKINEAFEEFLNDFVKHQNAKENEKLIFKAVFFVVIMLCFTILLIVPIILIVLLRKSSEITIVIALISALVEMISAILVLPKIIAQYLFDKEEDRNVLDIIKNMQQYNEQKQKHIFDEK